MIKFWHTIEYRARASQILIDPGGEMGEGGDGAERETRRAGDGESRRGGEEYLIFSI